MEDHNVFAGAFVDRNTQRRKDSHWLDTALLHENTRFIPICGDYFLIGGDPLHLKPVSYTHLTLPTIYSV